MADPAQDQKQVVMQASNLDMLNNTVNMQAAYGNSHVNITVRQDDIAGVTDSPKKAVAEFLKKIIASL